MLTVAVLFILPTAASLAAGGGAGLQAVFPDYENVRLALVADSLEEVSTNASNVREALEDLQKNLSAEQAGVKADALPEVEALLPEAVAAARQLEEAKDLESARDAFHLLTEPLVRWRQAAGEGPSVAYCPMKKRSWLQAKDDEIGNPYLGQTMPTCGTISD